MYCWQSSGGGARLHIEGGAIQIRRLGVDEIDEFLDLPLKLRGNDPLWVPPIRVIERRRMAAFMRAGALVLFAAERGGQLIGTMSALRDKGFEEHKEKGVAWFGYLEAVDEGEVIDALFAAVCEQARAWGANEIRGPRNLTRFEDMGVLTEGFAALPPFLQHWHPPHYHRHLERMGLQKHHDVLAYETPVIDALGRKRLLTPELREKADACHIEGLALRASSRRRMRADLLAAHEVLNEAFQTVPDIAPIPRRAWVSFGRTYMMLADPRLLQLATVHGRPAGFAACFPELNEAFAAMHGSVLPLGWLRMMLALRHVRTASFKLIGVLQEFRGTGLHAKLIEQIIDGVRAAGYRRLEASVVDERNGPMRSVIEGAGMTVYQRWRVYTRPLAP